MLEHFPFDLLIIATHCGDSSSYRWIYQFTDSEGRPRTCVVDIAIGVARTDDPDMLRVVNSCVTFRWMVSIGPIALQNPNFMSAMPCMHRKSRLRDAGREVDCARQVKGLE